MTVHYFFYGSLQDPGQIRGVLDLPRSHAIVLRPARVAGYKIKMWGPYPALVRDESFSQENTADSHSKTYVDGMVYEVMSDQQEAQFQFYETRNYTPHWVEVEIKKADGTDGDDDAYEVISGKTFIWNGSVGDLQEGTFDLHDFIRDKATWFGNVPHELDDEERDDLPMTMEIRPHPPMEG